MTVSGTPPASPYHLLEGGLLVDPADKPFSLPGVGVVVAEDPAHPGQGVFGQLSGGLVLPQLGQPVGEVVRRGQGVGVVVAEDPPPAGQGVLVQLSGGLVVSESAAGDRESVGGVQGGGVVGAMVVVGVVVQP